MKKMAKVDTTKPVLVTGANGYVASWLVKRLVESGIHVHCAVRQPKNKGKVGHLEKLAENTEGKITFFQADLLEKGAYKEAMKGCELVYHTASPFTSNFNDPQKDLIDPAVKGTENVLQTATETDTVKKVVVTSSVAAMYTDAKDTVNAAGGELNEEVWNTTASLDYQPYSYSKLLAEKKAWEMADGQDQWKLVTINPSLVLGPPLNPKHTTSESMNILKMIGDGELKMGAPKLGIGLVDVRDVAEAHFLAGFDKNAKGRYLTSAHNTNLLEMAETLLKKYGQQYPLPTRALPKWLLVLVGPLVNNQFSRKFIRNNVDIPFKANNSKVKKELNLEFKPMKETMEDSFQALIDGNIF
jgi:nucleoside-diphosphate-sugar epimerase